MPLLRNRSNKYEFQVNLQQKTSLYLEVNNFTMKKAVFVLLFMLIASSADAQANHTAVKFSQFFKANQPDSIYNQFTQQMKSALTMEGTKQLMMQIKGQLGEIVRFRETETKVKELTEIRLSFEKPLAEIALLISKDSIAGLFQKAAPANEIASVDLNSPNNFSVVNPIGRLDGTLVLPKDKKKVPVVLMIGGSGPTDRNMNQGQSLRTNAFLLLAKRLAENGIASLRYDKRGVGTSIKAVSASSLKFDDFIDDAKLFISKLATDERFSDVIVLGHSEGAAIGLIASLQTNPAAFISLCGFKDNMVNLMGEQFKPILSAQDFNVFSEIADSLRAGKIVNRALPIALAPIFTPTLQSYLISTLKYDPSKEIQKLKIPLLVVGGSTDLQVPAAAAIQLAKINNKATLKIIPEMNHVLKKALSDRISNLATYNSPDIPLHEDIVPLLVDFIKENCN